MDGPVSKEIVKAIKEREKGWTVSELVAERDFICGCLELYYQRCEISHDRISTKTDQQRFDWINETRRKINACVISFPTASGVKTVQNALTRLEDYYFVESNALWFSRTTSQIKMS